MNAPLPILDHLAALADGLRSRLLLLVERRELTVGELCKVLQLPQSTVSRHLKTLLDAGWIRSRRDGTRRLYHLAASELGESARGLWELTRQEVSATASARQDAQRLEAVWAEQRSRSREFFDSAAGHWDRLRDELFGHRFYLHAIVGLLDPEWTVADLGCGTGSISGLLAPVVRQVIAVDAAEPMLEAARGTLAEHRNVDLRRGELEALPLHDAEVDAATLVLVLHLVPEPARVVAEVARVIRPGGRLLVVDMLPHDRVDYRQEMGHIWAGFDEESMQRQLSSAGFERIRLRAVPPEPAAKGPTLFTATATRRGGSREPSGSESSFSSTPSVR